MKKLLSLSLALMLGAGTGMASAQDTAEQQLEDIAASEKQVTQAELAHLLVGVLGLSRNLPAEPSDQEVFSVLYANKIAPEGGWQANQVVTRAALARIVVLALQQEDLVEKPDDPESWINHLKSIGVPIGSVGQAVDNLNPLAEAVAPAPEFISSVDPRETPKKSALPDNQQYGADIADPLSQAVVSMREIQEIIIEAAVPEVEQEPVTPN